MKVPMNMKADSCKGKSGTEGTDMRIFIMGAGATGGMLAQLLRQRHYDVWCGDADADRARLFTRGLVECRPANARNVDSIVRAARGCHLLVNTVPAFFNTTVIQAALCLGVHYPDRDMVFDGLHVDHFVFARRDGLMALRHHTPALHRRRMSNRDEAETRLIPRPECL